MTFRTEANRYCHELGDADEIGLVVVDDGAVADIVGNDKTAEIGEIDWQRQFSLLFHPLGTCNKDDPT